VVKLSNFMGGCPLSIVNCTFSNLSPCMDK
jgi:hypothetical protein